MSPRPDDRLADAPMIALRCRRCRLEVEVRKASWYQTSVQWPTDEPAATQCQERPATGPAGDRRGLWAGCESLRASIRHAVSDGSLPVPDDVGPPAQPQR